MARILIVCHWWAGTFVKRSNVNYILKTCGSICTMKFVKSKVLLCLYWLSGGIEIFFIGMFVFPVLYDFFPGTMHVLCKHKRIPELCMIMTICQWHCIYRLYQLVMALCCDIAILQGYLELELFLCEWVITDESFAFAAEQRINGSFRSQNKNTWIKGAWTSTKRPRRRSTSQTKPKGINSDYAWFKLLQHHTTTQTQTG